MTRNELIQAWRESAATLAVVKEREANLRQQLVQLVWGDNPPEGTHNLDLGEGYKLKATIKMNYNLDPEKTEAVLEKIEKTGPVGVHIAERLVRWEPRLSLTQWRDLDDKLHKMFSPALTIKPSMPSLEFVEPKAK